MSSCNDVVEQPLIRQCSYYYCSFNENICNMSYVKVSQDKQHTGKAFYYKILSCHLFNTWPADSHMHKSWMNKHEDS